MEGAKALRLAVRYQLLALVAVVVGAGIAYAGVRIDPSVVGQLATLVDAPSRGAAVAAAGPGLALIALGVGVVLVGRTVTFYWIVGGAVEADIDEQLTEIERDLTRELRSLKRELTAGDDALDERISALEAHHGGETTASPTVGPHGGDGYRSEGATPTEDPARMDDDQPSTQGMNDSRNSPEPGE